MGGAEQPVLILAHADWSAHPRKRWLAIARREAGGWYAEAPRLAGEANRLLPELAALAGRTGAGSQASRGGTVLAGFDFRIGIPFIYAQENGVTGFLDWLPSLGSGEWAQFFLVANSPGEISLQRPFYPDRPGNRRQAELLEALKVKSMDDLRRRCERGYQGRRPACPLFWTLGGQQVGKAAIHGWQELLLPAISGSVDLGAFEVRLWPFEGRLASLLQPGNLVLAETYSAEYYRRLGVRFARGKGEASSKTGWGKRSPARRRANAPTLLAWAEKARVRMSPELQQAIAGGFGESPAGEDAFDALVGLFGMIGVVNGEYPAGEPADDGVRRIEGAILGMRTGFGEDHRENTV